MKTIAQHRVTRKWFDIFNLCGDPCDPLRECNIRLEQMNRL